MSILPVEAVTGSDNCDQLPPEFVDFQIPNRWNAAYHTAGSFGEEARSVGRVGPCCPNRTRVKDSPPLSDRQIPVRSGFEHRSDQPSQRLLPYPLAATRI